MPSGNLHKTPASYLILAGLEAGILGGVAMLAVLGVLSAARTGSAWTVPNLLASTFYGERALASGFRLTTLAGLALQLILAGLVGALFGLIVRDYDSPPRVLLFGLVSGLGWYYLCYSLLWRSVNPLVPLYSPDRAMLAGHVVLGLFLGAFPACLRHLRKGMSFEQPPPLSLDQPASQ